MCLYAYAMILSCTLRVKSKTVMVLLKNLCKFRVERLYGAGKKMGEYKHVNLITESCVCAATNASI